MNCPRCNAQMVPDNYGGRMCVNPNCCYDGLLSDGLDICPIHREPEPCDACLEEHLNSFYLVDYLPDYEREGYERP